MLYLALKALHIVSVVLFLGNIITGVFWKVHADLSGDLRARAQALDGIIRSDRLVHRARRAAHRRDRRLRWRCSRICPMLRTFWIVVVAGVVRRLGAGVRIQGRSAAEETAGERARRASRATGTRPNTKRCPRPGDSGGSIATAAPLVALFLMVMKPA